MIVKGWYGGSAEHHKRCYGIKVHFSDRGRYFQRDWSLVHIEIEGFTASVPVTKSFWGDCPELRHSLIGEWMKEKGLAPWPKGHPPEMELTSTGEGRFRLRILGD